MATNAKSHEERKIWKNLLKKMRFAISATLFILGIALRQFCDGRTDLASRVVGDFGTFLAAAVAIQFVYTVFLKVEERSLFLSDLQYTFEKNLGKERKNYLDNLECIFGNQLRRYRIEEGRLRDVEQRISIVCRMLHDEGYIPDIILGFGRSSSVVASLLAINLGVEQMVNVSLKKRKMLNQEHTSVKYEVDSLMPMDATQLEDRCLLIPFAVIDTGRAADVAIDYVKHLEDQGIHFEWRIAA